MRMNCQLVSGPGMPPKSVQIEIDTPSQTIKETYSNPDGSKLGPEPYAVASIVAEYNNGRKVDASSESFVESVNVAGEIFTWSRKGTMKWNGHFSDQGLGALVDPGRHESNVEIYGFERTFSLETLSGEYKEHYVQHFAAGPDAEADVIYKCAAASSSP